MYQQENNPYTAFTMPPTGNPMSPDLARFIMSLSNLLPQNPMLAGNTIYDNIQHRKQMMQDAASEPSSAVVGATPQTQSYQAPQMTNMPRTPEEWAAFRAITERMKQQHEQQQVPQKTAPKGRIKVIKKTYIDETGTPVDYYVDERGNKYDYDPNLNNF